MTKKQYIENYTRPLKKDYTLKDYLALEHFKIVEVVGDVVVLEDLSLPNVFYELTMEELQERFEWWKKCYDFTINFNYLNNETEEDRALYDIEKYLL